MAQLAEATGSVISAVLFGALAGAKVLPMQRMAFEAAIHRGGVGVKASIAAFGAGFAAAEGGPVPVKAETPAVPRISPALAPLMAEAERLRRAGADVRAPGASSGSPDYQDVAYAREYLDRLKPIAEIDKRHGSGSGSLLAETARELALGMAYEDTVRVAELKIRPSRFERVRAEVQAADGQIVEIAEFLHPRVQEIADTLPAGLGRWLLATVLGAALRRAPHQGGRVVKTSSIRGFLLLYFIASLKPTRRRSLRFANEQAFLREWLRTIETVAATNYALATEIATTRTLVKGYSDTHERGRRNYDTLMRMLPLIMETPDPAAALAALRKAALADDTGAALNVAIKDIAPAAAGGGVDLILWRRNGHPSPTRGRDKRVHRLRHHRRRLDFQSRLGLEQPADLNKRHRRKMVAEHRAIGRAELAAAGHILVHVDHVPGQAHDMLRARAALGQNREDVFQRLPRLRDKSFRKFLVLVPADHAADKDELAARLDAVGVALGSGQPRRLERFVLGGAHGQGFGTVRAGTGILPMMQACARRLRRRGGAARSAAIFRSASSATR